MFGYVKPVMSELLMKDYEFYRSCYCGICRSMKSHTGIFSNLTLTYDSVFLSLVRMVYLPDADFSAKKRRCVAHPLKRRCMLTENEATVYTARAFAILTYYKLLDDLHDEKFLKRAAVTALRPIVASAKKKADLTPLAQICAEKLSKITELEDKRSPSVDDGALLFGELLAEIFSFGYEGEAKLVTYECGLHLGKFIYAADAAEDYEDDRREGKYNPYIEMYGGEPLTEENRNSIKCALVLECKKIEGSVNLMPFGNRYTLENLIKNIIYLGLMKRIEFLDKKTEISSCEKEKKQ